MDEGMVASKPRVCAAATTAQARSSLVSLNRPPHRPSSENPFSCRYHQSSHSEGFIVRRAFSTGWEQYHSRTHSSATAHRTTSFQIQNGQRPATEKRARELEGFRTHDPLRKLATTRA